MGPFSGIFVYLISHYKNRDQRRALHQDSQEDDGIAGNKACCDKAAEPDNIEPRLLKTCSNQLASIFTFIFNWSLATSTIPLCITQSTIVPVPKKPSPETLN
ncbi:Non-LTR (Long terminal repeat) retrotransposon and domain-containing protein [Elysia marginata]|uniref:Non-LTR (Long terminal repeat) retrotransposon and domain-containing protein n=1 Tax=Elysia marginata TaxID=1093978 RepID=A0AAV4JFW5_9GAST|nr:Non-LTR (Long terminal repeat) retrotransposon and domain-containing protein [Elysia marginata]